MRKLTRLLTRREQAVVIFILAVILVGGIVMRVRHANRARAAAAAANAESAP